MKCQKCIKAASLHITEMLEPVGFEELHLCEDCAKKFFNSQDKKSLSKVTATDEDPESDDAAGMSQRICEICGIKFVEFRNSGRLGCPHDYNSFRVELLPLLESIHGKTRHAGKTPRRLPAFQDTQHELGKLRKHLQRAVSEEAYEEAAHLRDRIKQLENP